MLSALKFVKGAVAKKDFVPELTHFHIADGRITGYNGTMALSSPIDTDIRANPKALLFFRAIEACTKEPTLKLTDNGRLIVQSGRMRAQVPCIDNESYFIPPAGNRIKAPKGLPALLKTVAPFIGEDASRPWCLGALFDGPFLYATNNVTMVQMWTALDMPTINVPKFAIDQIIRIGEDPIELQSDGVSLTVYYEDGRWIRTQLFAEPWPLELVNKIIESPSEQKQVPEGFVDTVEKLTPFTEGKSSAIYFLGNAMGTGETKDAVDSVVFDLDGIPEGVIYNIHQLRIIGPVATTIDFKSTPCMFYGENIRGAMAGMN